MFYLSRQKNGDMRVLIVAATREEIPDLINDPRFTVYHPHQTDRMANSEFEIKTPKCEILITGVGMVATAFALGRHLAGHYYHLAINLGIAGSFDRNIPLGAVVEVTADIMADFGAEDGDEFIAINELGFGETAFYPVKASTDHLSKFNLEKAAAITVNTVHGSDASIKNIIKRLNPQLESMEGAAFFYACREKGLPCVQIRAVSNYVEKRNRANWQIGLAIKNLNIFAVDFLKRCV